MRITVRRKRTRRLHPWVFSNEVRQVEGAASSTAVADVYEDEHFIGRGIYNRNSLIAVRLFTRGRDDLTGEFFARRLRDALALRTRLLPGEEDYRLVFGESDDLPGLVIDRYGATFVLSTYALGMDACKGMVGTALATLLPVTAIYAREDTPLRQLEGLAPASGPLVGPIPGRLLIREAGVRFEVDPVNGQKTGFYFDQRTNRQLIRQCVAGRHRVLDLFCYTGSFAVNAALGGGQDVRGVDSSSRAVELAAVNARLNDVACRFETADAFDFLRASRERYDLIIADPPSFARSQKEKKDALRGYKELAIQALRHLMPGGLLLFCCCAHHVGWPDLHEVLAAAATDVGRTCRVLARTTQSPDHPVLLAVPETEYLRCFLLEVP